MFVMMPSQQGLDDYQKYVRLAHRHPPTYVHSRTLSGSEELDSTPTVSRILPLGAVDEVVHYLVVHRCSTNDCALKRQ